MSNITETNSRDVPQIIRRIIEVVEADFPSHNYTREFLKIALATAEAEQQILTDSTKGMRAN